MAGPEARLVPDAEGEGLDALRAVVISAHPELAGASFRLLTTGWDCVALDVDDRLIVKVPRHDEAAVALQFEARLLDLVRPAVTMPVPELVLFREPRLHSCHAKLPGRHLEPSDYASLAEAARDRLAERLGRFLAELHAIPVAAARAAGARPEPPWPPLDQVASRALPRLPKRLRAPAQAVLDAFAQLGPDPLGDVLGYFDAHGWNMAWDHEESRLNGLFDFGDAGIGGPHLEFVAVSLVGADLAERVAAAYGRATGRSIDLDRVAVLAGGWRLSELAEEGDDPDLFILGRAVEWVERAARSLDQSSWPADPSGASDK